MGGSKGGGGGQNVTQTSYTSNIPQYARPYFEELLERTRVESSAPYQAYEGERIAGFTPQQQQAFQMTQDVAGRGTPGVDQASQIAGQVGATGDETFQGERFSQEGVQRFMDPYLENVLKVQQDMAARRFAEQRAGRSARAVSQGAFGGSRQAVAEALAQRDQNEQLAAQEAQALSEAYRTSAQQFETEQQRMAHGAQQGAATRLAAGQQLGGLEQLRQQLGLQGAQALANAGQQQQQLQQQRLQQGYSDFLNQRDWRRQQLGLYSSVLHGGIVQPTQDVTTSQAAANPFAQALGAGIGSYGLMGLLRGQQ
ncbi:MAG: hypothetical protein V6Z86_09985 [Hyphomicrobiales bacterium]